MIDGWTEVDLAFIERQQREARLNRDGQMVHLTNRPFRLTAAKLLRRAASRLAPEALFMAESQTGYVVNSSANS